MIPVTRRCPAETGHTSDPLAEEVVPDDIASGRVIAFIVDPDTGEWSELRALTSIDRARLFWNDDELRRFARVLGDAHGLVVGGCVPRSVRRDLGDIVDELDELLHGAPHCEGRVT